MRQLFAVNATILIGILLSSCQTEVVVVDPPYRPCSEAIPGTFVTCQIARTHCDYRPDVDGQPTFCNDAPFPGHSFTLLVWGEDWSDFDGRCLLVTGEVVRFRGDPEIIATSRSQVEFCQ